MDCRTTLLVVAVALGALGGCTIPLRTDGTSSSGADDGTALDGRLSRCAALGDKASTDADCQGAWAEARRRILPLPLEK
jgi:conjugative transfer region protein TrbK